MADDAPRFTQVEEERDRDGRLLSVYGRCPVCEDSHPLRPNELSGAMGLTCTVCGFKAMQTDSDPDF